MTDDRWIRAALTDDAVVAELLVRLKQSVWDYSPSAMSNPQSSLLPLPQYGSLLSLPVRWGHRQPRSKPVSTATAVAAAVTPTTTTGCSKKEREPTTRCSPITPLSWSSASTSDDSSCPDLSSGGRSKADFPAESETAKKSRKRKSFAELKEVEGFLLEERTHLNKELESTQVTFKHQISTSANLKRLKHGLHLQSGNNVEESRFNTTAYHFNQTEALSSFHPPHSIMHDNRLSKSEKDEETQERGFTLPDLNAIPDLNMALTEEETGAGNFFVRS